MKTLMALVAAASIGSAAFAAEIVVFDDGNPPFMYRQGTEAAGVYVRLTREAFKRAGVEADIQVTAWKRAVAMADAGEAALGGCYMNDERLAKYDFTDKLYDETLLLFVRKGKAFKFETMADLKGKKIGVMPGWSYGDAFDKARADKVFTAEEVESDDQNIKKLVAGRLDAIIIEKLSARKLLGAVPAEVEALAQPLQQLSTYVAFNKKAGKLSVVKKFNDALRAMRADGSYDKIAVAD